MNGPFVVHFDASSCTGCKACQAACKDHNDLPAGILWRRVYEVSGGGWTRAGAAWTHDVFAWNLSLSCNHCERPVCAEVCPTGAVRRREDGVVLLDSGKCMGCRYCEWACPYGAPRFDAARGVMTKCDLCADRLEEGLAALVRRRLPDARPRLRDSRGDGAPVRRGRRLPAPRPAADGAGAPADAPPGRAALGGGRRGRERRGGGAVREGSLVAFTLLTQAAVGTCALLLAFEGRAVRAGAGASVAAAALPILPFAPRRRPARPRGVVPPPREPPQRGPRAREPSLLVAEPGDPPRGALLRRARRGDPPPAPARPGGLRRRLRARFRGGRRDSASSDDGAGLPPPDRPAPGNCASTPVAFFATAVALGALAVAAGLALRGSRTRGPCPGPDPAPRRGARRPRRRPRLGASLAPAARRGERSRERGLRADGPRAARARRGADRPRGARRRRRLSRLGSPRTRRGPSSRPSSSPSPRRRRAGCSSTRRGSARGSERSPTPRSPRRPMPGRRGAR